MTNPACSEHRLAARSLGADRVFRAYGSGSVEYGMRYTFTMASLVVAVTAAATESRDALMTESARWRDFARRVEQNYFRVIDVNALVATCRNVLGSTANRSEVDPVDLCIETALTTLDRESSYVPPKKYADAKAAQPLVGIGLELATTKPIGQPLTIVTAISGSPADRGGIRPGDRILEIDGLDVRALNFDDAYRALRGAAGSHLVLKLERRGEPAPIELSFTREAIQISRVRARRLPDNNAWVRVSFFAENAAAEFLKRLDAVAGPDTSGLVIDLRTNPGGSFDSMIEIASLFCEPGFQLLKVTSRGEQKPVLSVDAGSHKWLRNVPVVVLVDRLTGGGAEALAQILRERRKAKLVGEATAGAALITTRFDLGGTSAVRLATARMDSGLGMAWLGEGLQVDVPAADTKGMEFGDSNDVSIAAGMRQLLAYRLDAHR
ncbi:S41 family peptidase [Ideonella sp. YS5]|uniref:S41 family peptidase n=1 Tax=Ideonella sp. YS5 TaxID=3453714 RepID=UPI003EEF0275